MPFNGSHYLGENPILLAHHEQMIAQYERAERWRYIAKFLRELGEWEGEVVALFNAYEANTAAESLRGLFGAVCSAHDGYTMQIEWPRPHTRCAEVQIKGGGQGVVKDPYNGIF